MRSLLIICFVLFSGVISITGVEAQQYRVAVAHFVTENVTGTVQFTETEAGGLLVQGSIRGKLPGRYGFHVHELGDTSSCAAVGGHYNPDGTNHGGRNHTVRHVGDLGNLYVEGEEVTNFSFTDNVITLRGPNNILGRGLVLHAQEDDLGLGGDEGSLITGNAGARVACATIGMHAPVDAWDYNSSSNIVPSIGLLALLSIVNSLFRF